MESVYQRKLWNIDTRLDWSDLGWRESYPFKSRFSNQFAGFPDFENLPESEKLSVAWEQHATDIADILYGEWAALILSAQLLPLVAKPQFKLFLSMQIADEVRHLEFFNRYSALLDVAPSTPAPRLVRLIETNCRQSSPEKKLLVCQVIIENLAMSWFKKIKDEVQIPLLQRAIRLIARDEAGHIKGGAEILRERVQYLDPRQKNSLSQFVYRMVLELSGRARRYLPIGLRRNWDERTLLLHLRSREVSADDRGKDIYRRLNFSLGYIGLGSECLKPLVASQGKSVPEGLSANA
jgi:hypothetical protein